MSAKAKLSMTGRDIQETEIKLEFDKVNCLWNLVEHDVYDEFANDESIIRAVCNYMKKKKTFRDTSTQLLNELVKIGFVEEVTPAALSKKLRNHADILVISDGNDDDDSNIV